MDPITNYVDQLSTLDFADLRLVLGYADEADQALARFRRGRAVSSLSQAQIDHYDSYARPQLLAAVEVRASLESQGQRAAASARHGSSGSATFG
jgi:hypothetical protein